MARWLLGFVCVLAIGASALAAVATQGDLNPAQAERYHALTQQLRCLVCQNLSIADSAAPLAADLRKLVVKQIEAGRSDAQIKQFLVARYGDWVLYDPPFQWSTWLLWLGPFILLLVGLGLVVCVARPRRRAADRDVRSLDRQRLASILAESSADETASTARPPTPEERSTRD